MVTKSKVPDYKVKDTGEAKAPGYDDWFRAKVERALEQSRDRSKMIPAEEVWRRLGLED